MNQGNAKGPQPQMLCESAKGPCCDSVGDPFEISAAKILAYFRGGNNTLSAVADFIDQEIDQLEQSDQTESQTTHALRDALQRLIDASSVDAHSLIDLKRAFWYDTGVALL
jgi:hypothetical protein